MPGFHNGFTLLSLLQILTVESLSFRHTVVFASIAQSSTFERVMPLQSKLSTRHRWYLNYTDDSTHVSQIAQPQRSPQIRAAIEKYSDPPGFPTGISARDTSALTKLVDSATSNQTMNKQNSERDDITAAYQASWSVAFAPVRSMITSAFALYMTGSSVQFFSVGTTVTVLFMHVQAILSVRDAFRPVSKAGVPFTILLPQVFVHLLLAGLGVALGLYKANQLGFLPTTQSDWISLLPARVVDDGFIRKGVPLDFGEQVVVVRS